MRIEDLRALRLERPAGFQADGSQLRNIRRIEMIFVWVRILQRSRESVRPFSRRAEYVRAVLVRRRI